MKRDKNVIPGGKDIHNNELIHSQGLAAVDAEVVWGWNTPAGRLRATRRKEIIMAHARLQPESTALEVGCGTGLFTSFFAQSGASLVAVDISRELIEQARNRVSPSHRVCFVEGSFEDCLLQGPFDAVIGSSVLHHLDIRRALQKMLTLLKPGGVISFAEPNMLNPQIMVQKNVPWIKRRMGDSPDETAFFSWEISSLLREAGFQNIRVTPFDWLHPAIPAMLIRPVSRLGLFLERVPVIRAFAGSLHIAACRPRLSPTTPVAEG